MAGPRKTSPTSSASPSAPSAPGSPPGVRAAMAPSAPSPTPGRARERDEEAIARWAAEGWQRLKKSGGRGSAPRPDRRERLLSQPAGAALVGARRPDAGAGDLGPAPRQGVGDRGADGLAGAPPA